MANNNIQFRIGVQGSQQVQQALTGLQSNIQNVAGATTKLAGLLAGIGAGAALKGVADSNEELKRLADRVGTSVEYMSTLRTLAKQTGLEFNELSDAVGELPKAIAEANAGDATKIEAFARLKLDYNELAKMMTDGRAEQAVTTVLQQIGRLKVSPSLLFGVGDLLGDSGLKLISTLQDLSKNGFEHYRDVAVNTGTQVTEAMAQSSIEFNRSFRSIGTVLEGATKQIAFGLSPAIVELDKHVKDTTETSGSKFKKFGAVIGESVKLIVSYLDTGYEALALFAKAFTILPTTIGGGIGRLSQVDWGLLKNPMDTVIRYRFDEKGNPIKETITNLDLLKIQLDEVDSATFKDLGEEFKKLTGDVDSLTESAKKSGEATSAFINNVGVISKGGADFKIFAETAAAKLKVAPEAIYGQLALESAGGKKTVGAFNYGNLKGTASGGSKTIDALEYVDGKPVKQKSAFKNYSTLDEAIADYVAYIQRKYPKAVGATSAEKYATALKAGGYATDPNYIKKVVETSKGYLSGAPSEMNKEALTDQGGDAATINTVGLAQATAFAQAKLAYIQSSNQKEIQLLALKYGQEEKLYEDAYSRGLLAYNEYSNAKIENLKKQGELEQASISEQLAQQQEILLAQQAQAKIDPTQASAMEATKNNILNLENDALIKQAELSGKILDLEIARRGAIAAAGEELAQITAEQQSQIGNQLPQLRLELNERLKKLRQVLDTLGLTAAEIDRQVEAEQTRGEPLIANAEAQQNFTAAMTDYETEKARLEATAGLGAIEAIKAEDQILKLQKERLTVLQDLADTQLRLAIASKDPAAIQAAKQQQTAVIGIKASVNETGSALDNLKNTSIKSAGDGLANFFKTLITDTSNAKSAFKDFARSVLGAIADMASKALSQMAIKGALSFFGGPGAATGGLATTSGIQAFAGGGAVHRQPMGGMIYGKGTPTSDEVPIVVSNREFIVRNKAVETPGAIAFLNNFNRYGTPYLNALISGGGKFAEGGLADTADFANNPGSVSAGGGTTELKVGLETGLVVSHLKTPEGRRVVAEIIKSDKKLFKGILN